MIITPNNATNINVANSTLGPSSMDQLTLLQFALLKDSDDQLKGMVKQMQANVKLKDAYRNDLNAFKNTLNKVKSQQGKEGEKKIKLADASMETLLKPYGLDKFVVNDDGKGNFNNVFDYQFDTDANSGQGGLIQSRDATQTVQFLDASHRDGYYLTETSVQGAIDYLTSKMDKLNAETDQLQIYVQDLTGKRKSSLEAITSLISKTQDVAGTINRNIGK